MRRKRNTGDKNIWTRVIGESSPEVLPGPAAAAGLLSPARSPLWQKS